MAAGAEVVLPVQLMFWGDRYGQLRDPFGVMWSLGEPDKSPTQCSLPVLLQCRAQTKTAGSLRRFSFDLGGLGWATSRSRWWGHAAGDVSAGRPTKCLSSAVCLSSALSAALARG